MTRGSHEIWREGMLSDMETLRAEKRELHAEVERLRAERDEWKQAAGIEASERRASHAEIERLKAGMEEYACTATDHPCGCYDQFLSERAEIERLTNAIRRIDGINDYPANYSPAINAICDAILRPHLEPKRHDPRAGHR